MAAKFSPKMRNFICDSIVRSINHININVWKYGKPVIVGEKRKYNGKIYISLTAATTGVSAPTHISGIMSDGTVDWLFVEYDNVSAPFKGNIYMFVGRNYEWTNENYPDIPSVLDFEEYNTFKDIISLKKITSGNAINAIKRWDWVTGATYSQYDSTTNIETLVIPFYVVTDEYNVYKCIDNNNNSPSTIKPSGKSVNYLYLSDGYVWKYMMTVSNTDLVKFATDDYIPVTVKNFNDLSEQWLVQEAAQFKSVSTFKIISQVGFFTGTTTVNIVGNGTGLTVFANKHPNNTIKQVLVTTNVESKTGGTGYDVDTYALIKETSATGSGFECAPTIVGGMITGFDITNGGTGYTSAQVFIIGDGTGAAASATISGLGAISQLVLSNTGSGYTKARVFVIPGTAACLARAVMAPIEGHGKNVVTELFSNASIISMKITVDDENFVSGPSSDFRQLGIITDILGADGNLATETKYIGPSHPDFGATTRLNKITPASGKMLYINNVITTIRASDTEKDIRIIIAV